MRDWKITMCERTHWSSCTMSCGQLLIDEHWVTTEPDKLSWNNVQLPESFSKLCYWRTNDLGPGYQAQIDLRQHVRRCPLNDEVYIQDGSSCWHRDDECDELYESGREIRTFQFCPICARQDLTVPGDDAMEFFTEHGVRVVNAPANMQFT